MPDSGFTKMVMIFICSIFIISSIYSLYVGKYGNVDFDKNINNYKYVSKKGDIVWTERTTWLRGIGWSKEVQFGLHTNGLVYWRDVNNFSYEENK